VTEFVDEVDQNDTVLRVVTRAQMRAGRLMHRAVFIAVVSTAGQLLIHRRSESKDLWPGWWDIAVGGVVGAGESYDAAAIREVREEIGLEVGVEAQPAPVGAGSYVDDAVALLGRCYVLRHNGPFEFADGEVVEARFVSRTELEALRTQMRFLPDSLALLLPLVEPLLSPTSDSA
jgi:isopentenyldiphosphate isomerase